MAADITPRTPPETTPDTATTAPNGDAGHAPPEPTPVTTHRDDEARMLWREGLPPDAVILVPSLAAAPMRRPENTWAMLVLAADVLDDTDPDRDGEVALFAGSRLPDRPPAAGCEGDLALVPTAPHGESPPNDLVDVEMLLAHRNRWLRVGEWEALDPRWPWTVAITASAIMALHTETTDTAPPAPHTPAERRPLQGWGGNGGITDLLTARLVRAGEEFLWNRRSRRRSRTGSGQCECGAGGGQAEAQR
ncbi:hypothetical protein [Saccharothrix xinjiangensis]|uniref:Uncharacterized protein n=1 Tax=Saccharothrix xinjiangensis TaxID=204798 RepID=A0ABV9Y7M6_9PSEU